MTIDGRLERPTDDPISPDELARPSSRGLQPVEILVASAAPAGRRPAPRSGGAPLTEAELFHAYSSTRFKP